MDESVRTLLAGWTNFYLLTGTAAATLTGLQFIAQTLIVASATRAVVPADPEAGIAAFGAPTVTHLLLTLVISSLMCVPWPGWVGLHVTLVLIGLGALIYSAIVFRRAMGVQASSSYVPVFEDWLFHAILPIGAYLGLFVGAFLLAHDHVLPLFVIAAATLLLLVVGIHNAWDTVSYLTVLAVKGIAAEKAQ